MTLSELPIINRSYIEHEGTHYALIAESGEKKLAIKGYVSGFMGQEHTSTDTLICPLSPENAHNLRTRLRWLNPTPLLPEPQMMRLPV